jgi:predicted SnoaL-like aldol condensation-catalyzing enzyme
MSPKEMAVSFLKMAGSGKVREAYEQFIAPDFIHHNQYFKGDRESLMLAMEEAARKSPNKSIDIKHVYEAGDTVITHSHVIRHDPAEPGIAVVHVFRFKNGRVAELWDLGQPMMKDSPNENGMF